MNITHTRWRFRCDGIVAARPPSTIYLNFKWKCVKLMNCFVFIKIMLRIIAAFTVVWKFVIIYCLTSKCRDRVRSFVPSIHDPWYQWHELEQSHHVIRGNKYGETCLTPRSAIPWLGWCLFHHAWSVELMKQNYQFNLSIYRDVIFTLHSPLPPHDLSSA